MKRSAAILSLMFLLALAGCTNRAAEILDTAQLEEKQQSLDHARELYQQIVRDYPDSPEAKIASERLTALTPP